MNTSNGKPVREVGVEMHGVRLNLRCEYDKLLDHIVCLVDSYACDPWDKPDLEVNATWLTTTIEEEPGPFAQVDGLDKFGKRMYLGEDTLVWPDTHRNRDLQLRFRKGEDRTIFDVVYRFLPSKKKFAKYGDYEQKKYFDLLRYLVMFPIAWHLERTRGWVMIHASAVADADRAVLIAGPGGAGKTTTCMALISRACMKLITENLLFWDGELCYPVFEPIRLTDESMALLGEDVMAGFKSPGALKTKAMFLPPADALPTAVKPAALFLPQFSQKGFVRLMDPEVANELLVATNRLTLELNDFYWYSAALDVLWPKADNALAHLQQIKRLAQRTPCYSMGIDRAGGVDPVVDHILECLNGPLQTVGEKDS